MDTQESATTLSQVREYMGMSVMVYQLIERLLKTLLTINHLVIPTTVPHKFSGLHNPWQKQTMGTLVKEIFDRFIHVSSEADPEKTSPPVKEITFTTTINITTSEHLEWQRRFSDLVVARNNLIHHFYEQHSLNDEAAQQKTLNHIKSAYSEAKVIYEYLESLCKTIQAGHQFMEQYFQSDEGISQLNLALLQNSQTMESLVEFIATLVAKKQRRWDDWIPINWAGENIQKKCPDTYKALLEKRGYKTLKECMQASELFEFETQATKRGFREVFRARQDLIAADLAEIALLEQKALQVG